MTRPSLLTHDVIVVAPLREHAFHSYSIFLATSNACFTLLFSAYAFLQVTVMTLSPNGQFLAVGYADGKIRIWTMSSRSVAVTLNGHRYV